MLTRPPCANDTTACTSVVASCASERVVRLKLELINNDAVVCTSGGADVRRTILQTTRSEVA